MDLVPAIDLLEGNVVRLHQGDYERVTVYAKDPAAEAARLRTHVRRLHVVDLEGARTGAPVQRDVIGAIVAAFGPGVQVGGGVRSLEAVEAYLALGVDRVVLGTAAVRDPELVRAAAERHPGRVIVGLDARDGMLAVDGWRTTTGASAVDVARSLAALPLAELLYTDIARDGTQTGPNLVALDAVVRASAVGVLASGGVGTLEDLRALARIPGLSGAIVGRALYEGSFSVEAAVRAVKT